MPRMAVMSVPAAVSDGRTDSLHRALNTRKASFCRAASICSCALPDSLEAWAFGSLLSLSGAPGMPSAAEARCPAAKASLVSTTEKSAVQIWQGSRSMTHLLKTNILRRRKAEPRHSHMLVSTWHHSDGQHVGPQSEVIYTTCIQELRLLVMLKRHREHADIKG